MNKFFSGNLLSFIFANQMTRQAFADRLNDELIAMGRGEDKVYTANDIWTYDSRGSIPKDAFALVAIGRIMGVSLEDLLTEKLSFPAKRLPSVSAKDRLARLASEKVAAPKNAHVSMMCRLTPDDDKFICCKSNPFGAELFGSARRRAARPSLDALTPEQREFLVALIACASLDESANCAYLYTEMHYDPGRSVTATIHVDDDLLCPPRTITWTWQDFGEYVESFDDIPYVLELGAEDMFSVYTELGLIKDYYFVHYEDEDEDEDETGKQFCMAVYLSDCDPDISVELYKEAIEKLTAKRDELMKNSEDKDDETAKTPDSPSADGAPVSPEEENK